MKAWFILLGLLGVLVPSHPVLRAADAVERGGGQKVFILPIREDIMPPLVYLVRRGVKEAMQAKADTLVIDMDTNGGRVDVTEEIIQILNQFPGEKITFVNRKAFSAGAFISVATRHIYMAPESVIGAAAPILAVPGGGVEKIPDTVEAKMTSGIKALVRASASKNGHNVEVIEAMIDRSKELKIDDKVLNEKGQILTLTNDEAERRYGQPPKALLSAGTVANVEELLKRIGLSDATRTDIKPTGAEKLATWITRISPLLLMLGVVALYIEFKTPGFGLPGIVGISAFAIYFLGGYVAGLSGWEWPALFVIGLVLVGVELFLFPGTVVLGLGGAMLMLLSIVMGMMDFYPGVPALPTLPTQLGYRGRDLLITITGSALLIWLLSRWLPKTAVYGTLVSSSASGVAALAVQERQQASRLGQVGVTISVLRPGGKARFGEDILDVIARGEMIAPGSPVRIVDHSGHDPVVESAG